MCFRVYCLIVDVESAVPGVWEALAFVGHFKLKSFVAIFDSHLKDQEPLIQKLKQLGFYTIVARSGHNSQFICEV